MNLFTTRYAPAAIALAALSLVLLGSPGVAQDDAESPAVFSGPQKGEKLLPFKVAGVFDDDEGKELDLVAAAGKKPLALIFVHKVTRPSHRLVRMLTEYCRKLGEEKVHCGVVWLDADRTEAMAYLKRARNSLRLRVPVGVSVDGEEGPGAYGLNRNVTLTVLAGKEGEVTANFALVQPNDTDAPTITAEIARLAAVEPPAAEELAALVDGGRSDRRMRRGAPEGRRGEDDPRFVNLLRGMIQKENKAEDVARAAAEIEAYIAEKPALQTRLGEITSTVSGSSAFKEGGYGIAEAREQIQKWATKYGPKAEEKEPRREEKEPRRD